MSSNGDPRQLQPRRVTVTVAGTLFKQNTGSLVGKSTHCARLCRHHTNAVDPNANQVLDEESNLVGWVPRHMTDIIAPAIDSPSCRVEVTTLPNATRHRTRLLIKIYNS